MGLRSSLPRLAAPLGQPRRAYLLPFKGFLPWRAAPLGEPRRALRSLRLLACRDGPRRQACRDGLLAPYDCLYAAGSSLLTTACMPRWAAPSGLPRQAFLLPQGGLRLGGQYRQASRDPM